MSRFPLAVAVLLFPLVAFAQKDAKIPDPDPEIERKTFVLPEGFEVNLFAADPMLAKPIQMNFDPAGRLWIAASEVYPQIAPGQKANDRVLILEDTDGDGKADKTTVFAEGLLIPTAVIPGDGGAYVADSTDLVHFSDPDPTTGKARTKRIVLSGFGTEDTHHILHTLRWGPDGSLHFSQSIYIHSHIETPHGPRRLNAGGVWTYRPKTQELSVLAKGLVNSWGTAFDRYGRSFWTDGAGGDGINILMPGMYGFTAADAPRILPGLNPGSPKHCGLAVASGRGLPADWQGDLLTNDFRGHRVCRFKLKDDGSGYQSQEQQPVIRSNHPAFRPIDVAMGPDGAIYIADWYNPIIQHGEVDFRDPRRDKTHGRIWRVTAKAKPPLPKPKLVQAGIPELLEALKSPEGFTREMAMQVLRERDPDAVLAAVRALDPPLAPAADEQFATLAQVLRSVDRSDVNLLASLLRAKDHRWRGTACRLIASHGDKLTEAIALLTPMTTDPHPQVRLEAVRGLALFPSFESTKAIVKTLDFPMDRWLDYAVWLALRESAPQWLPETISGARELTANPAHLVYALNAAGTMDVGKPLLKLARNESMSAEQCRTAWAAVAKFGKTEELGTVFREGYSSTPADYWPAVMNDLVSSYSTRRIGAIAGADWVRLPEHFADPRPGVRAAAYKLVGLTKHQELRPALEAKFNDSATPVEELSAIAEGLILLGGPASMQFFSADRIALETPERGVVRLKSLVALDPKSAAPAAAAILAKLPPGEAVTAIVVAFVNRKGGTAELTKALAGKKLPADSAKLGLAAVKATALPDAALVQAFTIAGELTTTGWKLAGDELAGFLKEVGTKGDPARGEAVYRKAEMNCRKCHAIAGAGGLVGPDLSSIGASAPVDYLLESLILPNAKIKEGYNSFVVTTIDGRIISGIRVRESKTELVLRDNEGREIAIPTADIEARKDGASLMPAGLVDPLTRQELLDLTRFLSELGKGRYAATPGKRVRSWQALSPTKEMYTLLNRVSLAAAAGDDTGLLWQPAYSNVNGELPVTEMPQFNWKAAAPKLGIVRFRIEATTAGPATLTINDTAGLTFWLNGQPIAAGTSIPVELKPGANAVTIAVEWAKRKSGLTVDLEEVPKAATRARLVGAK